MTFKTRAVSLSFIIIFMVTGVVFAASSTNRQNAKQNLPTVERNTYYTLNYDANGGEKAPVSAEVKADGSFVISRIQPEKDGYTFLGWSCDKNAAAATFQAGSNAYLSGNTTVYAVWSK